MKEVTFYKLLFTILGTLILILSNYYVYSLQDTIKISSFHFGLVTGFVSCYYFSFVIHIHLREKYIKRLEEVILDNKVE